MIRKASKNLLFHRCIRQLSSAQATTNKMEQPHKSHGNMSDQDRIFSNLYCDQDPFINGALKRVFIYAL